MRKEKFIRAWSLAFIAIVVLVLAHPVLGAPTCQDRNGLTIRCRTDGSMPVGWTLPLEERFDRQKFRPPAPTMNDILELICALGVFFALMALQPEFDGRRAGDWDKQEDDD
jgi:hypothetical protein